jgi:exo-beta-1,3-glucanase (GH17 family)
VVHAQGAGGRHGALHQAGARRHQQPVTTNDNWLFWASVPKAIAEVVDFAAVHTYPFLDTFYNPTAYDWRQKHVPEASARRP